MIEILFSVTPAITTNQSHLPLLPMSDFDLMNLALFREQVTSQRGSIVKSWGVTEAS